MDYKTLMELALQGRTVNDASRALGIPQPNLHRYTRGERIPDFDYGLRIAQAAGVDLSEAFIILAEAQRRYKQGKKDYQQE